MQTITLHLGYSIRIMIYNAFAVKLKGSITNVVQSFLRNSLQLYWYFRWFSKWPLKKEETHLFNSSVGSKGKFSNTFFQIAVYFVFNFGDTALKCAPVRHLFTGIKVLLTKISGRIKYKPSMNPQKMPSHWIGSCRVSSPEN